MPTPERSVKTLAIRLDEELHAQLSVLAQLSGMTVTDAIRQAIEAFVSAQRSQGDLAERAAGVLAEIEREATARRSAIQALFGPSDVADAAEAAPATTASPTTTPAKRPARRGTRPSSGEVGG